MKVTHITFASCDNIRVLIATGMRVGIGVKK